MRIDPESVPQVAAEIVLELVLGRDVNVAPIHLASVERDVAVAMREALRRKAFLDGCRRECREAAARGNHGAAQRFARFLRTPSGTRHGMVPVAESILIRLRWSPWVEIRCDDRVLLRKIRLVFARTARHAARRSAHSGEVAPPPPGAGPAGGSPAQTRVSEHPPRRRPSTDDLDRRGRSGRN